MSLKFEVSVVGLDGVLKGLEGTPEQIAKAMADGINAYAIRAVEDIKRETISRLNLTRQYVDDRIVIKTQASESKLESTITAPVRGTLLSRYGATVNAVANDWTEQKYIAKFGSLDAMTRPKPTAGKMPWTPRKGDPMRGIPKGKKSNGIRVAVRAGGGQQNISYAFLMPLSAGSVRGGNGLGVFARPKSGGKMKSIYGPSLDQIAKRVWTNESDRIGDELSEYVADHIDQQLKVLK